MALAAALAAKKAKMGFKGDEDVKIDTSGPEADLAHPFFGKLKQNNASANKLSPRSRRLQEMTGDENPDKENDSKNANSNSNNSISAAQKSAPKVAPAPPPPAPPVPAPVIQLKASAPLPTKFPKDDDDYCMGNNNNTSVMGVNTSALPAPDKEVDLLAGYSASAAAGTLSLWAGWRAFV
jgi:hypothetical protein